MNKSIILECKIQAFSDSDILDMIPTDILKEIREKDPHPIFKAYVVGHEGVSTPRIIDGESRPITWGRKAVQTIKNVIKRGLKFFKGHNKDNSTDGREPLGEVIARVETEKDGELQTVVIGHFPKDKINEIKNYDVCSMEAEWSIFDDAGKWFADKIENITGIALQSSKVEKPAFSGARTLGMVQAFEGKTNMAELTVQEIKRAIRDMGFYPSQIFSEKDIEEDVGFKKIVSRNDSQLKELNEKITKLETEKKEADGKYNELVIENKKATAVKRYTDIIKDPNLNLTDKERTFIEKKIDKLQKFEDDDIKAFIEENRNIYKEVASIIKPDGNDIPNIPKGGDKTDVTKPENNELLGGK